MLAGDCFRGGVHAFGARKWGMSCPMAFVPPSSVNSRFSSIMVATQSWHALAACCRFPSSGNLPLSLRRGNGDLTPTNDAGLIRIHRENRSR